MKLFQNVISGCESYSRLLFLLLSTSISSNGPKCSWGHTLFQVHKEHGPALTVSTSTDIETTTKTNETKPQSLGYSCKKHFSMAEPKPLSTCDLLNRIKHTPVIS
jgi:hypothetical protein